jgi:hypothetical protein
MKRFSIHIGLVVTLSSAALWGQSGDAAGTRAALARAAENNSPAALSAYAGYLDRYGDPEARAVYARLADACKRAGDSAGASAASRRLTLLDLLAGDRAAAQRDASAAGATVAISNAAAKPWETAAIPGPLRSFARMAALSPDVEPEDILPALARNVVTNGYEASQNNEALEQTEYLKLVHRYLSQARELEKLAGDRKVIEVPNCDTPIVADLTRILGFRMRGGCGSDVVLETVNAARAFLTTDSGFPVNQLEEALRTNRPFTYDFHATRVPVLFGPEYWMGGVKDPAADFIESFIGDPANCRLYLGFSKLDPDTAAALRKEAGYSHWKAFAHVLDFFGGMFEIRNGAAVTPGGARSAQAWAELVGVNPDKGAEFLDKLVTKDDGWLCSLFDALARIRGPVRDYLTDPPHMKRYYAAVRGRVTSPGPARPVFRANADMMLLSTRLQVGADGKPHIPGSLEVWKNLFTKDPQGKYDGKLTRLAATWKEPDDVIEALFALCRKQVENEPLKIFMAISDVDRGRAEPLASATVERLVHGYHAYGSQYTVFTESRRISDKSILQFLDTADAITRMRDPGDRGNTAGAFQALVSLWQILVRQGSIPEDRADAVFADIVTPFAQVKSSRELFEAARGGVKLLLGGETPAAQAQERMVDLLSGASSAGDADSREEIKLDLQHILDAQQVIPLDTLLQLAAHLEGAQKLPPAQLNKLIARLSEFQIPRPPLTASEKNSLGFGYWTDRHLDAERKLNLKAAIEKAAGDPAKIKDLIGLLAPLMRDTLLAFNYAHYAPPGAQIVYTNPLFVRSHDFIGGEGQPRTWHITETYGSGWPSNGGGRLVGSLSTLPYALAEAEQNFLVPTHTQALIWGDLVPQMILSAKIPRWWNVTPAQVHWVGLHLRYGRELLAESALDAQLRSEVLSTLAMLAAPARTTGVRRWLEAGDVKTAAEQVTPSELFSLAQEIAPRRDANGSPLLAEMLQLAKEQPREASYAAISRAFGTPKPTLANSYQPEMLNLRTFPTLMGYSSRILAESWESNTLYWAALADELNLPPAQLNVKIPEWTQKLVEQIFASHLEDWPAVLRSLRAVGDDVRQRYRAAAKERTSGLE